MKSVIAFVALGLVATAQAQSQCAAVAAKIPSCATKCIASAAAGVGCSDPSDLACQCKNTAAIDAAALNCVLSGCGPQTGIAVQASASAVCECVKTAGSGSEPTKAPASAPASTPVVQTGHGPVETKGAASAPASSAAKATGAAAPFPTVSAQASQISDGQIQASGAASPSAALPGNSTVPFTGAGVRAVASVGSLMLAAVVAIAAL